MSYATIQHPRYNVKRECVCLCMFPHVCTTYAIVKRSSSAPRSICRAAQTLHSSAESRCNRIGEGALHIQQPTIPTYTYHLLAALQK